MALDFGVTDSPLERLLLSAARSESLETQLSRWHRFAGEPTWLELQALKIMGAVGSWERSRFAHADDVRTAARLAAQADKWTCPGVYLIANPILSGVATRAAPGQWHDARKGESTSDAEIARRSVLFIDVDARRPKGTSATDEEVAHTARVARSIYDQIATILGNDQPLALGASGNGRADLLALDHLDVAEAGRRHQAILVALAAKYTDEHVEIDRVVHDAKRLIPCWGTTKRKGAPGIPERPHRRSALICSDEVPRVSMADLDRLLDALRRDLADEVQRDIDRALGLKVHRVTPAPTSHQRTRSDDTPFTRANALDVGDVLSWLGLMSDDRPICPGCGLSDAGVAIVGRGLKCSHSRCAGKGVRAGFRTIVDVVAEKQGVSAREAVIELADRFNFEGFPPRQESRGEEMPDDERFGGDPDSEESGGATTGRRPTLEALVPLLSYDEIFAPEPEAKLVVPALGLGPGPVNGFLGSGYSGKTIVALSWGLSVASGRPLFDVYHVQRARWLHLDHEQGRRHTKRRLVRLMAGMGLDREAMRGTFDVSIYPRLNLTTPGAEATYTDLFAGYGFITIDAFRGVIPGVDENKSEVRDYLDLLGRAAERSRSSVLILHHTGKPPLNGPKDRRHIGRGSSSIYDAMQSVFVATADRGEPIRVSHEKDRELGRTLSDFGLQIVDVEVNGDPKGGLRVDHLEPEQLDPPAARRDDFNDLVVRVVEIIKTHPGCSGRIVRAECRGVRLSDIDGAIEEAARRTLIVNAGKGRRQEWRAV